MNFAISNDLYDMKNKMEEYLNLYGNNVWRQNYHEEDIARYARAAVELSTGRIRRIAETYGYNVEFDSAAGYPEKVVFRIKDREAPLKSGYPEYFRIDTFGPGNTFID